VQNEAHAAHKGRAGVKRPRDTAWRQSVYRLCLTASISCGQQQHPALVVGNDAFCWQRHYSWLKQYAPLVDRRPTRRATTRRELNCTFVGETGLEPATPGPQTGCRAARTPSVADGSTMRPERSRSIRIPTMIDASCTSRASSATRGDRPGRRGWEADRRRRGRSWT
jgi:hypothetical protein